MRAGIMKTWIIESETNHGLLVHVVNAETKEEAKEIAEAGGAWDGYEIYEIDTLTHGVVHTG
jgi:hypothetical protein